MRSLCFSPDNRKIVIGDSATTSSGKEISHLKFCNVEDGKVRTGAVISGQAVDDRLTWEPKSDTIFAMGMVGFAMKSTDTKIEKPFFVAKWPAQAVELAPDGKTFAVLYMKSLKIDNGGIHLKSLKSQRVRQVIGQVGENRNLAFSKDGDMIASSMTTKEILTAVRVWDTHTGQLLHTFKIPQSSVTNFYSGAIQFSPIENLLVVVGHQGNIFLWNGETGRLERTLKNKNYGKYYTTDTRFSPDGRFLFTVRTNGTITRWRIR